MNTQNRFEDLLEKMNEANEDSIGAALGKTQYFPQKAEMARLLTTDDSCPTGFWVRIYGNKQLLHKNTPIDNLLSSVDASVDTWNGKFHKVYDVFGLSQIDLEKLKSELEKTGVKFEIRKKKCEESKVNEDSLKPNIDAEDFNMEDYSKDDLSKLKKSKTEDIADEVKDKDVKDDVLKGSGNSNGAVKVTLKMPESKSLHLCNDCCKTFRSMDEKCTLCGSDKTELVGEVNEDSEYPEEAKIQPKGQTINDVLSVMDSIGSSVVGKRQEEDETGEYVIYELKDANGKNFEIRFFKDE
jgi:hypothetical protein